MTVTLRQVVEGIKDRLGTIDGLYAYDHPPAVANFPLAFPAPPPINYRETMRAGVITLRFDIALMEATSAGHEQQLNLYDFLDWAGDSSIFQAFEADRTLGFVNVDAVVVDVTTPLGLVEIGGYEAFGVTIPLMVTITNT